ncbi:MAG: 50S ribosomal protein L3 [Arenicella sp.]|nr:50S ribosomal protein L3 [Arenicella sp.]
MSLGLIGQKIGMTRVFQEDGRSVPVTVVEVSPNRVTQVKTIATDGYEAVQVSTGQRKSNRVSKALAGHYAKANVAPGTRLAEFRVAADSVELPPVPAAEAPAESADEAADEVQSDAEQAVESVGLQVGSEITVNLFEPGQKVDVQGTTIGKGFAGGIKRWGFGGLRATHGVSVSHRSLGSTGQCQDPGKVFKGKKMGGHMGARKRTQQGLEIVRVDSARNVLLVKGSVPGSKGGSLVIKPSVKAAAGSK